MSSVVYYRQYDTMICPRSAKTVKKREQLVKWFKEKVRKKQEEAVIPQPSLMRQMCLEFHLLPSKNIFLQGNVSDIYDVSVATNRLIHLFECCYQQKVSATTFRHLDTVEIVPMEPLREVYI